VEAVVEGDHPDGFFFADLRHDRLLAHPTPRGEDLVEVLDAVDAVGGVDGERDPVEAFAADHTAETLGVVGFARGAQDAIQDRLLTHATFFQGVLEKNLVTSS
jgi:hypothetical protein